MLFFKQIFSLYYIMQPFSCDSLCTFAPRIVFLLSLICNFLSAGDAHSSMAPDLTSDISGSVFALLLFCIIVLWILTLNTVRYLHILLHVYLKCLQESSLQSSQLNILQCGMALFKCLVITLYRNYLTRNCTIYTDSPRRLCKCQ